MIYGWKSRSSPWNMPRSLSAYFSGIPLGKLRAACTSIFQHSSSRKMQGASPPTFQHSTCSCPTAKGGPAIPNSQYPAQIAPNLPPFSVAATQADVVFPGGKKTKADAGAPLATVAKKAGYKASYGCEEGKCGTCEHKARR